MPIRDNMPVCLQRLSLQTKDQLQTTLANDEASSDEELMSFFCDECAIPQDAAEAAIKYRPQFFVDPFFNLFGLFDSPPPAPGAVALGAVLAQKLKGNGE